MPSLRGLNTNLSFSAIFQDKKKKKLWSVQVAKCLVVLTLNHEIPGLNPAGGRIQFMTVRRFIAQNLKPCHAE